MLESDKKQNHKGNMTKIFSRLMEESQEVMEGLSDNRRPNNALKYKMQDAGMGALSIFMMQDPSFLSHQERLSKKGGIHNFKSLFGCSNIPTPNHIRNMLDNVSPVECEKLYKNGLSLLEEKEGLSQFKTIEDGYLIALDGTQHYSSKNISCEQCSVKHKKEINYSHSVVCATIVSPNIKEAIPLIPEFIVPQDGHDKQDCENAACKRWLSKNGKTYKHLNPTILGDDLFSRQPICESILNEDYNFILTCKPDSHKTLYEYLDGTKLEKLSVPVKKRYKNYIFQYKFMNSVPIRDGEDALLVNWFEVIHLDKKTGKRIYKNTFITNHRITKENVHKLAAAGRARWRLENENNNTLKTKGYRFGHNYGHGKKNLCSVLATFTIVAFLYHTVMSLVDLLYLKARSANGARINFFNMIKHYTSILLFSSWNSLMSFILEPPDLSETIGII
jgi:hypothetical protein